MSAWIPVAFLAGCYVAGRVERSVVHAGNDEGSSVRLACGRLVEAEKIADAGAFTGCGLDVVTCDRCKARVAKDQAP